MFREVGVHLANNFQKDARTMLRWYILVVMGQKAGHLALGKLLEFVVNVCVMKRRCIGIDKAAAATVTWIPEEFKSKRSALARYSLFRWFRLFRQEGHLQYAL